MNWTPSQQTAIGSRGRTLLVSAAAGSGKTAVLTERIITRLTDPDNPADISRMLIVTFTKAAAAELKERISAALKRAMEENPNDKSLARQAVRLNRAKICTIHSFCFDIIRRNFDTLGLPAKLRVADETEMKVLYSAVMNEVIESYYDAVEGGSDIADFSAFTDTFITERDAKLSDIFLDLYRKLCAFPEGIAFLNGACDTDGDFMRSGWGVSLSDYLSRFANHYIRIYGDACDYMNDGGVFAKNYLPGFASDLEFVRRLNENSGATYGELRELLSSYAKVRLGTGVKKDMQDELTDFYKKSRDDFAKAVDSLRNTFFAYREDELAGLMSRNAGLCADTSRILTAFDNALSAEKKRRGIVDFIDLERLTYSLLYNDANSAGGHAAEIAACFDEIYIDEYQDVNRLQDAIFGAIANDRNRFMVGDIKQSIYGFRGASPEIFSEYRDRFPKFAENDGDNVSASTVFLSDNFRCDRSIIDFTNIIFGVLFKNNSGQLTYYDEDRLNYAKTDDGHVKAPVEVTVIRKPEDNDGQDGQTEDSTDSADDIAGGEADYVVGRIERLIAEGYRPSDIVILLRSAKSSAEIFEEALKKLRIPCFNTATKSFFENAEILLMLCLLNCIDNPSRDIYLVGALKSPLYGFTLDELVRVRSYSGDGSFCDALKKYTDETGFDKGRYFLDRLGDYRKYAEAQSVDRLIWYIYRDTALLSLVYENDSSDGGSGKNVRRANLMLLYDYARRFEAASFRGLYNFIGYVNDIISERVSFEAAKPVTESDDAVRIMTVHQSKGLEFPVCFLCGADKGFNFTDARENMLFGRSLGMAFKLRDETGYARFDTPMRQAVALDITSASIEEEMRVLYVALTRARERLIVTASSRDPDKLLAQCVGSSKYVSSYSLAQSPSYIKWILTALYAAKADKDDDCCIINTLGADVSGDMSTQIQTSSGTLKQSDTKALSELIGRRFDFVYPYAHLTNVPAKLSVSKLAPDVLDSENDSEFAGIDSTEAVKNMRECPAFLEADEAKATAAERGTATHIFMQFCDYNYAARHGVRSEIERLVTDSFITPRIASLIYIEQAERFFDSELYKQIKNANRIWRETRFNIRLPAAQFTQNEELKRSLDGESMLVQGVIDCFYIGADNKLRLVDYKTDYIPREMRSDLAAAREMLVSRHARQLGYYREACSRIACMPVESVYIYSFALGDVIEL